MDLKVKYPDGQTKIVNVPGVACLGCAALVAVIIGGSAGLIGGVAVWIFRLIAG